jgi:hypothetical protein
LTTPVFTAVLQPHPAFEVESVIVLGGHACEVVEDFPIRNLDQQQVGVDGMIQNRVVAPLLKPAGFV